MRYASAVFLLASLAALPCQALAQVPAGVGVGADVEFSTEAVDRAIDKAAEYLLSKQEAEACWAPHGTDANGPTALVLYALLHAHVRGHLEIDRPLAWLNEHRTDDTYHLALHSGAWAAAARFRSPKYRKGQMEAFERLVAPVARGDFAPGAGRQTPGAKHVAAFWAVQTLVVAEDFSGFNVPPECWRRILEHWTGSLNRDGGWGYEAGEPSNVPMTAAGVWAVQRCHDFLGERNPAPRGTPTAPQAVAGALAWLERHMDDFLAGKLRGHDDLPTCLYYLQHAAAATGRWHPGGRDLYRQCATALLRAQQADGSWDGASADVTTAHGLMALSLGSRPAVIARLEYDGDWNNRPLAPANITDYVSKRYCCESRHYGWQILNVRSPVDDWSDSHVLLITGSGEPTFTDEDVAKLRTHVERGGLIFTCAEAGGRPFSRGIRALCARMFPDYALEPCEPDHDIYEVDTRIKRKPRLSIVSNGVRPLVVHCEDDLTLAWQKNAYIRNADAFNAAANIVRCSAFRTIMTPRGSWDWPAEPVFAPRLSVTLARLDHPAGADPEPPAWKRFRRLMGRDLQVRVNVLGPMPIAKLAEAKAAVAILSGMSELTLDDEDSAALQRFVAAGGTLVVEAIGGAQPFARSAEAVLRRLFPDTLMRKLEPAHPLYRIKGLEIEEVGSTLLALRKCTDRRPRLRGITRDGRLAVVFSADDMTAALLGREFVTSEGYRPASAVALMRNIVLSAAGATEKP